MFGGFVWEAGSAYFAGTNAIRSAGAALKESGCLRFGGSCFPAGTLVATAPDKHLSDTVFPSFPTDMLGNTPVYLPIERLQVGDVVVSRNECSGATEHKTLVGRSQSKPLCRTAKPTAICCSTRKAALPAQSLRPTDML